MERLGIGTVCQGWAADLPADLDQYNARHYAAFSRLASGDLAALIDKGAAGQVDLLVIEGRHAALEQAEVLSACAPLLGPQAVVLIVGAVGGVSLPGMTAQALTLGAEDLLLLARPGAGDARFAAFAAAETPAARQPLVALFNRLGNGLRHEARSLAAQELAERLAAAETARTELAAAYADRHQTLSRMQAMVFDLVSERDANRAAADEATQQRAEFDLTVSRVTSLTQDKLHLEAQLALRFRELATLTVELDRAEKEREAAIATDTKHAKMLESQNAKLIATKEQLAVVKRQLAVAQEQSMTAIRKLKSSTSWKITKPLRGVSRLLRRIAGRG